MNLYIFFLIKEHSCTCSDLHDQKYFARPECSSNNDIRVLRCSFSNISSTKNGGVFYILSANATILQSQFYEIYSTQNGGSIYSKSSPTILISRCYVLKSSSPKTGHFITFDLSMKANLTFITLLRCPSSSIGDDVIQSDNYQAPQDNLEEFKAVNASGSYRVSMGSILQSKAYQNEASFFLIHNCTIGSLFTRSSQVSPLRNFHCFTMIHNQLSVGLFYIDYFPESTNLQFDHFYFSDNSIKNPKIANCVDLTITFTNSILERFDSGNPITQENCYFIDVVPEDKALMVTQYCTLSSRPFTVLKRKLNYRKYLIIINYYYFLRM